MKSTSLSRDFQAQLTKHMDTKPRSSNNSSPGIDYPDLANAALSDMFGFPPEMVSNFGKMMPSVMGGTMGMPSPGSPGSAFMPPGMMPSSHGGSMMSRSIDTPPMDLTSGSDHASSPRMPGQRKGPTAQVTHMDLNKWREKQFEVMSKYMHNKDTSSVGEASVSDLSSVEMTESRDGESKDNSPASVDNQIIPFLSSTSNGEPPQQTYRPITVMSESQNQRIARFIHYSRLERHDMADLISEVHKGIVASHLEHCYHQRPRINAVSAELDVKEQVCMNK